MYNILIYQSIKLNSNLLEIDLNNFQKKSVKNFILNLDNNTKFMIIMGSILFVLVYLIFLVFPKRIQFKILSSLPLINKILHFYRKLILITLYEK